MQNGARKVVRETAFEAEVAVNFLGDFLRRWLKSDSDSSNSHIEFPRVC